MGRLKWYTALHSKLLEYDYGLPHIKLHPEYIDNLFKKIHICKLKFSKTENSFMDGRSSATISSYHRVTLGLSFGVFWGRTDPPNLLLLYILD